MKRVTSLQMQVNVIREEIGDLYAKESKVLAKLDAICDHAQTAEYVWEHDNGYGRQTRKVGTQCVFCRRIDYWNDGRFERGEASSD